MGFFRKLVATGSITSLLMVAYAEFRIRGAAGHLLPKELAVAGLGSKEPNTPPSFEPMTLWVATEEKIIFVCLSLGVILASVVFYVGLSKGREFRATHAVSMALVLSGVSLAWVMKLLVFGT